MEDSANVPLLYTELNVPATAQSIATASSRQREFATWKF